MTARTLAVSLLLAAAFTPAFASTPPAKAPLTKAPGKAAPPTYDTATFNSLVGSDVYLNQLRTLLPEAEPAAGRAVCRTLKLLDASQVEVVDPPQFTFTAKGTQISSGAWINTVIADRCGDMVKRRLLVRAQSDKATLDIDPLLPGDFHGSLGLERAARKVVLPALAREANCAQANQIDVTDVAAKGPVSDKGWSETWFVSACGTVVSGVVSYSAPAGGGTTIHLEDMKVELTPHLPPHPDGPAAANP